MKKKIIEKNEKFYIKIVKTKSLQKINKIFLVYHKATNYE